MRLARRAQGATVLGTRPLLILGQAPNAGEDSGSYDSEPG